MSNRWIMYWSFADSSANGVYPKLLSDDAKEFVAYLQKELFLSGQIEFIDVTEAATLLAKAGVKPPSETKESSCKTKTET